MQSVIVLSLLSLLLSLLRDVQLALKFGLTLMVGAWITSGSIGSLLKSIKSTITLDYCDYSLPILHRFDDRFARRSHFHSNLKSVEVGLGRPKSGPTFVPVGAWFAPGSTDFCLKAIVSRISLIFLKFSSLILHSGPTLSSP